MALAVLLLSWLVGCSKHADCKDAAVSKLSQQITSYTFPSGFYEPNTTLRHEFRILNDTSSVVHFSGVSTSCSCTTAELTRKELQPNEETLLQMSLNLVSASGRRTARCLLSDDSGACWTFDVSATSYPLMEFAHGGNHVYPHLGMLNPGESASGAVDLFTYADPSGQRPEIQVDDVPDRSLEVRHRSLGVEALSDGFQRRRQQVTIHLSKQTEAGLHKADVDIHCRSGEASQTAHMTILWQVKSLYVVDPERIALGILSDAGRKRIRRTVMVERIDGKPLDIVAVRSSRPGITLEGPTRVSPSKQQLTVVVDGASFPGPLCGDVLVEVCHPAQPRIIIPVVGFR